MFSPDDYTIIAHLMPRLIGAIYFIAFWPFLFQICGLLGQNGILPITHFLHSIKQHLGTKGYRLVPTLFWFNASNRALVGLTLLGLFFSALLVLGIYPSVMLFIVYFLYLSIISVGQDFLSFGWELFLQEVALNVFLLSLTDVPNLMVWLSLNFLLFRFYLQSGAVKLQSRDVSWKNLTAIAYHYESQPIPNLVAWYVHKLPLWFHKFSCLYMYFVELIVPFFLFFNEEFRLIACFFFLSLQFFIWATGNFSYLNYLSTVFSLLLLNNSFFNFFDIATPIATATPLWLDGLLWLLGGALLTLQALRLWDHFFPNRRFRQILDRGSAFHICNRYGIFAIMTTTRYEMVVQGSDDGKNWKEYTFKHKPSELSRRPSRIAPYQPRLDWQAWFLPFRPFSHELWFQSFIGHLLRGTEDVLALIRHNPFPEHPPKYIHTVVYMYSYTSFTEKKESKNWWKRRFVGYYGPVCSLKQEML